MQEDWTLVFSSSTLDPCQIELCVVMRYSTDKREGSCFPFITALQDQAHPTAASSHEQPHPRDATQLVAAGGDHTVSNAVHSHPEDSLEEEKSVLAVSEVRINVHPQENSNKSYNVFGP